MSDGKKKILMVEDDEFLRSIAIKRLEKEDYEVLVSADGSDAVKLVQEEKPDLVLLDLLLPGISGFDILEKVKADEATKATPVIVFSNLGQQADIDRAKNLGASDFLIKANFTLDFLIEKLKGYLN
jgi:CheY-like chemotaxis protein